MIETYNISVEIVAPVKFLSANPVIIDRQTAHITNNLHLKLDIVARELCCAERWYKHDGKIFRAIHYAANYFALVYHGEHIEANQLTNSELILKDSNGYGEPPSPMQMKAKRLWIVDTTQPGISRSQYKRQKRRQQITSAHLATFFEESVRDITCQELEKQLPPWKRAN